jgi:hypothetical protein
LKAARKRLAKFRASTAAQAKAKAAKEQETAGEAPPKQLNKTWPEFVRLILAPKRRKRIDGSTAGNLDYLQTAERCRALFAQHGRLGKMPAADRQVRRRDHERRRLVCRHEGRRKFQATTQR